MTTSRPDEAAVEFPATPKSAHDATRRIAQIQTFVVAGGILLAVLWLFSDVLILLFAAVLLSCQLTGASRLAERYLRIPYTVALALIVVIGALLVAALIYWAGPRLTGEFSNVYDDVKQQLVQLWTHFGQSDWVQQVRDRAWAYIHNKGGNLAGTAASFVTSTIGNLGSVALILVGAIYLAIAPATYTNGTLRLMPRPWRERAGSILQEEASTLRRWFIGQLVDMAAIGAMATLGLWLLGVPLYLTLGCIAAVCNFVPYLGALAGSLPAVVVALGQSPHQAAWVAILFLVVQAIEGNLISPLISRRTVDLPPVLTLFAQTVFGSLFGPVGLILATPMIAAIMVLVRTIYIEDVLGDTDDAEAA